MTTAISIEDVRREVKILKALSGHKHLVKFHDACEDANNVYIVMEYVFSYFLFYFFMWNMVQHF
jgi:serine/threonine protein kinase